jgi:hypothetical protein
LGDFRFSDDEDEQGIERSGCDDSKRLLMKPIFPLFSIYAIEIV